MKKDDAAALWRSLTRIVAAHEPDAAIGRVLAVLGRGFGAERAWVVRYNASLTRFWNCFEWTRAGVTPFVHDLQGASVSMMLWLHRRLLRGEPVPINDVDKMPRQERSLQAELRRQSIKATLNLPVFYRGKLRGFYGFDYSSPISWNVAQMRLGLQGGDVIGPLLHRALLRKRVSVAADPAPAHELICIRDGGKVFALDPDEIVFIEACGDYSFLHMATGERHLQLRSLRTWSVQLPEEQFRRIHRGYLANLDRLDRVERSPAGEWLLYLKDVPTPLPIGRSYRHLLRQQSGS